MTTPRHHDEGILQRAALRVAGSGLDGDWVTSQLSLAPTRFTKEGTVGPGGVRAVTNVWRYTVPVPTDRPMETHLRALVSDLRPRQAVLKRMAQDWSVTVWCSYVTDYAQGTFQIPPDVMAFLSETGVSITVSVFSWGMVRVDEDEADD
ncbi:DUF4279 domain-containing protein [Limnochorda pilosa]|uniref:DUF4279 domain-containing protein n=1 Tax=Limnochorda pilosa TaxID=1555112 RepID=A0A0K2SJ30_LIMPI|nr:hypothetical protein LIP_1238 [Limnochorda pilosa]